MTLASPGARMRPARMRRGVTAVSAMLLLVLTGCARFDDAASSPFSPEPTAGPAEVGPRTDKPPTSTSRPPRPSGPCIDPDPNVVATCLDTTGGIVVLPDGSGALIAERRTGRILRVAPEQPAAEIARIDVDGSSDGGLLDLALSPTFLEDGLIYAYITTGSDNRVVRIAAGDTPKPVLEGIPRGATGNAGGARLRQRERTRRADGRRRKPSCRSRSRLARWQTATPRSAQCRPARHTSSCGVWHRRCR